MPLPTPFPFESRKHFLSRFLRNSEAKKTFPLIRQRFAVASDTYKNK